MLPIAGMATGMDDRRGASDSIPTEQLEQSYRELEVVLEATDLEREEQLAEAVIDAIDAIDAVDRARNTSAFEWVDV